MSDNDLGDVGECLNFGARLKVLRIKSSFTTLTAFAEESLIHISVLSKMGSHDPKYLKEKNGGALPNRLIDIADTLSKGNGCPGLVTRYEIEWLIDIIPAGWLTLEGENKVAKHLDTLFPAQSVLRDRDTLRETVRREMKKAREETMRNFDALERRLMEEIR